MSIAQSIFSNLLLRSLETEVDPMLVLETGASELRRVFSKEHLDDVLNGYMTGLRGSFALGIALAVGAFSLSFAPPMRNIKRSNKPIYRRRQRPRENERHTLVKKRRV